MKKVTMCDPPSGWRYGFPRPVPDECMGENFYKWLDECGYPEKLRKNLGEHFYCRFWEEEINEHN